MRAFSAMHSSMSPATVFISTCRSVRSCTSAEVSKIPVIAHQNGYNFFLTLWNLNYAYDKAQNKVQNKAQKIMMTDREHILLLLRENPSLTQAELSEKMNNSRRSVQMLMKELLDEGVIERIGSKKTGSWLVK